MQFERKLQAQYILSVCNFSNYSVLSLHRIKIKLASYTTIENDTTNI